MKKNLFLGIWLLANLFCACEQTKSQQSTQKNMKDSASSEAMPKEKKAMEKKRPTNPQEIAPIETTKLASYTIEDYCHFWLATKIADINLKINTGELTVGNIEYTIQNLADGAISEKDIKNGYIRINHAFGNMGFETMALWKSKKGKTTLGVASFGCGPGCDVIGVRFFEIQGEKLMDKTTDYLPENEIQKIKDKQLQAKLAFINQKFPNQHIKHLADWAVIPKIGTTIQFGWNYNPMNGTTETFLLACELQYDAQNGTFKLIEK